MCALDILAVFTYIQEGKLAEKKYKYHLRAAPGMKR